MQIEHGNQPHPKLLYLSDNVVTFPFVQSTTFLTRNIATTLLGNVFAVLFQDIYVHIGAHLLGKVLALLTGHHPGDLLGNAFWDGTTVLLGNLSALFLICGPRHLLLHNLTLGYRNGVA